MLRKIDFLLITFVLCLSVHSPLASSKTDTNIWRAFDPDSQIIVDHTAWQSLLGKYIEPDAEGVNRFGYGVVTDADYVLLDSYIKMLSDVEVKALNKHEQLAYWINLYNAVTVRLVIDRYPTTSIRKLGRGFFAFGPWDELLVKVGGEQLSLNDIEHRIIRPVFNDNRIHYAVNCASIGCPNLAIDAYVGEKIDAQLNTAACEFVQHPRALRFEDNRLRLSSIYKWYIDDFGGEVKTLLPHLMACAKGKTLEKLQLLKPTRRNVVYQYDWNLNDNVRK